MDYRAKYESWMKSEVIDEATKKELADIADDHKEIEDRFYKDLAFGTGGLRGILGAGTNRMNKYIVARVTQGLANYILKQKIVNPSVVIAHDCRRFSREFTMEVARVLNRNGIKAYVFDELRPTPLLSFGVRYLKATAGIVVTASHNPPNYNGYKVYWSDGAQIVSPMADDLISEINSIEDFSSAISADESEISDKMLFHSIGKEIDDAFIKEVKQMSQNPDVIRKVAGTADDFSVVYTPLHGTGNKLVRRALSELGFKNVAIVKEQELPDSEFSTVKSPNPEEHEAFTLAIKLAKEKNADIIIGTDPDCDRVGAVTKNLEGAYQVLTGNQTGALLIHYILTSLSEKGKLTPKSTIIDTIVTGDLGAVIARSFGVGVVSTLTGFKNIAVQIKEFEETGRREYVFGYEESYGYLPGDFVRDKDGVTASMLICEMAAWYKSQGKTLYEGLLGLYEKYGCYYEGAVSIAFPGKDGMETMERLTGNLRKNLLTALGCRKVIEVRDYLNYEGELKLPKENALYYLFEDKSWFCVRPSGTEPKLKLYYSVLGKDLVDSKAKLEVFMNDVSDLLKSIPS